MTYSRKALTMAVLAFALSLCACSQSEPELGTSLGEREDFESRVAEYIRLFPYQETFNYLVRYTGGDPARLNTWVPGGEPALTLAGQDIVVRMNNDTYYNGAVLSLNYGPVVLASSAPTNDRFYSFQLMDDRNVNYRNIIRPAGKYTLYYGEIPDDVQGEAIKAPSSLGNIIVRVEVKDRNSKQDVAAAKDVYNGLTISADAISEFPQVDVLSQFPEDVASEANRRIDETFTNKAFADIVVQLDQEVGEDISYLDHAAASKGAWGAPDFHHSGYETIFFDRNGDELTGSAGTYTVTTTEPPVDGFWSVTAYDTDRGGFFHPNPNNRYHWNGTTATRNVDGSFTFTFKVSCGDSDLNCLEVPVGRFDLIARYYLPGNEIVSGDWVFPSIELVEM